HRRRPPRWPTRTAPNAGVARGRSPDGRYGAVDRLAGRRDVEVTGVDQDSAAVRRSAARRASTGLAGRIDLARAADRGVAVRGGDARSADGAALVALMRLERPRELS